jgi:hypothetical protein
MSLITSPNVAYIDGKTGSLTATDVLNTVKTVDGTGSGLDADTLDGNDSLYYQQALVSGTNIKSINGNSILGSGNLVIAGSQKTTTEIIATAGQTVFTVTYNTADVDVYLNGVLLTSTDYTASSGTSITLSVAALVNDVLKVITYTGLVNATGRDFVYSISANTTAVGLNTYDITANCTLTLPLSPTIGDWVKVINNTGSLTGCIVARNGSNIMGLAEDMTIDVLDRNGYVFTYISASRGWVIF